MYNNKLILDYTSQISQKKIYRTMKIMNLANNSLHHSNQQHLDSIKKQLNFDNHDYYDTFSQERNYKNAKRNSSLYRSNQQHLDSIKKQLNFDNHDFVSHDYHDTFSQERNHKNSKTNSFINLDHDLKNIAIQLNFDK
jgi:hypothetical protein